MFLRAMFFLIACITLLGCSDGPITIEQVRKIESSFKRSLNSSTTASDASFKAVSENYTLLSEYLSQNNLTDRDLKKLESMLADLNRKRNSFASSLSDVGENGKTLISLLKKRADENSDRAMRRELNKSINARSRIFKRTTTNAKKQLNELDRSIQRFDNIVGYLQISAGLKGIDSIGTQINDIGEGIERLRVLVDEYAAESQELLRL